LLGLVNVVGSLLKPEIGMLRGYPPGACNKLAARIFASQPDITVSAICINLDHEDAGTNCGNIRVVLIICLSILLAFARFRLRF
jgi:hypothetical protein